MGNPQPSSKIESSQVMLLIMGIIYRYWLPANGKSYVGQTTGLFTKRAAKHRYDSTQPTGNCRLFQRALQKYTYDAFQVEILLECDDADLDRHESEMIEKYSSLAPGGYNLTSGGNSNKYLSQDTKELIHHQRIEYHADKFKDYPNEDLPFNIIRYRKSGEVKGKTYAYQGYAIHGHPKCKHKFFGKRDTLAKNLDDAKEYLKGLNTGEIEEQVKETLPDGIRHRKSGDRDGYEATYMAPNGTVTKKRFTNKHLGSALGRAEKWLVECSSTTKCESANDVNPSSA
jgi:group I intron endonuclease